MLASRQRNWSSYICWCDCKMVQLLWKMAISYKIKHTFSARNSWALYGREIKTYVHIKKKQKNLYMTILAALLVTAKNWKQLKLFG